MQGISPNKNGFAESGWIGVRESLPFCISTSLFGVLFGVAAVASGFSVAMSLVMSGATFSATAQFAALQLWVHPLPLGSILLSVFLVSSRNILLGLSVSNYMDGNSLLARFLCLGLLSDPAVVMILREKRSINNLGYAFGYGAALWCSWMISVWLGFTFSNLFVEANLNALSFAGPLVMATMMMLFIKSGRGQVGCWAVSGLVALGMALLDFQPYIILPTAVIAGVILVLIQFEMRKVK